MKKFTFLAWAFLMLCGSITASAQKDRSTARTQEQIDRASKEAAQAADHSGHRHSAMQRCGTDQAIEARMAADPAYKARLEAIWNSTRVDAPTEAMRTSTLSGPVTIPVVVHIVLPNPNVISDADVQFVINQLNLDFAGTNADSVPAGHPFQPLRGHSLIRWQLARRTPGGALTNGVERRVGNVVIGTAEPQAIKSFAAGGLNPWDHTQYYNIWVGAAAGGLLGIAPEIGVGTAANDGVCVNWQGFSNNPCYTNPSFNKGRTTAHEIGHNFGLFHTFQGGCATTNDFRNLTTPAQLLPATLTDPADDTPAQSASTTSCPAGSPTAFVAAGCASSPNPPGKMYQNYMDYTDDACYSMFSKGQVERMHYLLENFRPGYLTTQGHIPPAGTILVDAMPLESVNPGGSEVIGCTAVTYTASYDCPGAITPRLRIRNNGLNAITSVRVGYRLNNGTDNGVNFTGLNIPSGGTFVAVLPATTLANGANNFRFYTSNPNGVNPDGNPANDSLSYVLTIGAPRTLPLVEGFEPTTFPPPGWSEVSVNAIGTRNWERWAVGRNSTGSARIQNYLNSAGAIDDLKTPQLASTGTNVQIRFDVAYRQYSLNAGDQDSLIVLISTDCGTTFSEVYKKGGPALSTVAGASTASFVPANADQWRSEMIVVPAAALTSGKFQVIFRSRSRFGNNIYVDNVNIDRQVDRDLTLSSITRPTGDQCNPTITPVVVVRNNGVQTVNSFSVNYTVAGGPTGSTNVATPLAPGASATVTLPAFTGTPGTYTFTATVANVVAASGTGDQNTANDALSSTFRILLLLDSVRQDFNTPPIPGWVVVNPNAGTNTWVLRAPGRGGVGNAAFIDNFNNNNVGQFDDLRAPATSTAGADSMVIFFDLAHKAYPGSADRLQVLYSIDCGATFLPTTFDRSGAVLATAGESTADYINPAPADWRTIRVAVGGTAVSTGSIIFAFRNTNDFGNNVFIDNVNIAKIFKRDLALTSINAPASVVCATAFTPSVTIRNVGVETITGYKVGYQLNGGAVQTTTITGVSLAAGQSTTISLNAGTALLGANTLRVFTFEPIGATGTGDLNTTNDTLTKSFSVAGTQAAPLVEGFEGAQFPPAGWAVSNADGRTGWTRANTGFNSTGSAFMNNFGYLNGSRQRDELYTPVITYTAADSVFLSFDYAAVSRLYAGVTVQATDTLEVLVTRDCGASFTSIWRKWGDSLQTVDDPNFGFDAAFVPGPTQWRNARINLTSAYAGGGPVQVVFRNTNNGGNNVYIDNVNFRAVVLPALLKEKGYLILPTVFNQNFQIWLHRQDSRNSLRFVNVFSSTGQLVWSKTFNRNADGLMTVDLSSQPAGTYIVKLGFEDEYRNVSERVIKR